ncbi:membrane protein [Mycobacterium phage ThulaThula]|uniref:Uncharacterized protein n=2 Tax=Phayoncevirus TaxID=1983735 RepID=A0A0F6WE30_9CAUD|nr:hypothetical protein SEA_PHAYONCE_28 [Mycobacterium phage Phayonce]YP_009965071.1 membrane protein [Mycobacterium phage ThulaThula]AKF14388.1 hypothetical protein SEA_PHAYONCE_28 [Mycobacterium phage Phayonce]QFG09057.1 membrane protein [Mycobacterium phage ThulaThula]
MKIGKYTPSQIRKAIAAATGAVALLGTSFLEEFTGLIPESWSGPITWVIGAATALGVFLFKNAPLIDAADEL